MNCCFVNRCKFNKNDKCIHGDIQINEIGACANCIIERPDKKGLYKKYVIKKADGSPVDINADYFVLRLDADQAAREAAKNYASRVLDKNPELAEELKARCDKYSDDK